MIEESKSLTRKIGGAFCYTRPAQKEREKTLPKAQTSTQRSREKKSREECMNTDISTNKKEIEKKNKNTLSEPKSLEDCSVTD